MSQDIPINLNVGGSIFITSALTLKHDEPNYFTKFFEKSGWFSSTTYFIDRDSVPFHWILNYLRGYKLCFEDGPLSERHNLLKLLDDAKFYGLKGLEQFVIEQLNPLPSYRELVSELAESEIEFRKEWQMRVEENASHCVPKNYKEIHDLHLLNSSTPLELIQDQIKCREFWANEWKVERYIKSSQKMILSLCMMLEYFIPNSPFTHGLGIKMNQRIQEDRDFQMILLEAVQQQLKDREGKSISPTLRVILGIITMIYCQGLSQPRLSKDVKPNFEEVLNQYPELQEAYQNFLIDTSKTI